MSAMIQRVLEYCPCLHWPLVSEALKTQPNYDHCPDDVKKMVAFFDVTPGNMAQRGVPRYYVSSAAPKVRSYSLARRRTI